MWEGHVVSMGYSSRCREARSAMKNAEMMMLFGYAMVLALYTLLSRPP